MGRKKGKRWNSCLLWFLTSLGAFCVLSSSIQASDEATETFGETERSEVFSDVLIENESKTCTESLGAKNVDSSRKLVLVSTLDGKLSALEVEEEGRLAWSIDADTSPLLSSSISKLEISHDGVPTRYIPSLDGGLYKYDGESIEAVPMTAETLLSASFKLADNTVMVGGKDKHTYGVDPETGKVRYTCDASGCDVMGEDVTKQDDVLVITRQTQTVRAVDSRAGSEKWNFSVGQHEVNFIKGQVKVITESPEEEDGDEEASIHTCTSEGEDTLIEDIETFASSIKIVVPEGMVVGVDPVHMQMVTWQYKFKSPISSVWLLYQGELVQINMFGQDNIPALSSFEPDESALSTPLLYVGMHQSQLYVQSCSKLKEKVADLADRHRRGGKLQSKFENVPRVAWKPYQNTAQWRTPIMNNRRPQIAGEDRGDCPVEEQEQGLTIWHEDYPFDNGFYLSPEFSVQVPLSEEEEKEATEGNQSDYYESILDDYIPISLWNWWKEVIAISVVTSVIVHIVLTRVQRHHEKMCAEITAAMSVSPSTSSIPDPEVQQSSESNPPSRQNSDESKTEYVSRFESDFDKIEVLGKGGFGVVFETKNKVDECHYAVKRIALPNSDGAKEKVMREVKALATLDHIGIVRYFHAWIESPPFGWQEDKDRELDESEMPTSLTGYPTRSPMSRLSPTNTPPKSTALDHMGDHNTDLLGLKPSSPKPKQSPLDFLQNPFGGNEFDFSETDMKRGSSEEFTVHSRSDSFWDRDTSAADIAEEDEEESGSFSCGLGTPNLAGFTIDDSVDIEFRLSDDEDNSADQSVYSNNNNNNNLSSSPKSIPFSYKHDRSLSSSRSRHSRLSENNDSIQIVFEDSGCAENKSSKESSSDIYIGIPSSSGDMISSSSKPMTKSHSRNPSRDSAKITFEKEGKHAEQDKAGADKEDKAGTDAVSRRSGEVKPKMFLYIQMQLCKRETLKDWLSSNTLNRDRHTVLDMFDQITCAIEYVHDCGLMHRDLKPSNIFFSLDGVIKMGDFGLVQTAFPDEQNEEIYGKGNPYKKHTAQVGTTMYMSPEQMSGKVYSQKVDIFTLGLILFEMLYPFATNMERVSTLLKVKQQTFPERFCREMEKEYELVRRLVSPNPDDRPTAKELLSSPLLSEFESRRMPRRFRTRTISQNSS